MSQISGATSVDLAVNGAPANRFSELESEDFLRIIFTELTNQDPLQPNDTSALLEQLNSIRSIESDLQLTNQLEALVTENQLASASNLLGKLVSGRTEDLTPVTGKVVSIQRAGDAINLELEDGSVLSFSSVERVVDPNSLDSGGDPGKRPVDDHDH